ncbi:DNA-dependent metalloprotease WSS1 isoform X2 [Iris pallida]|uniref:DNA-dependent metalloprotease WSS1 isoform X2 n=1 Tax=Iris pallida TaxID=29817 RepID=A0AAX6EFF0_IRIPA|nr:DNA-dependent metalloprotease WSS1 isoform X2 [Iris pallida]
MSLEDLNKVWEVRALKRKPNDDEARRFLERIASQVQPIMRRRKWKVKLLSEFCPTNHSLLGLNVNRGVHVKLRLRRPNADHVFFPFEEVLDTMLHELCHIVHGPHDAQFYKLWDELRVDCEELVSKGITGSGQGFDAPGRRLGGFTRQPPLSALRQNAAAAAAKRARIGALLPSGPRRLGGDSGIMAALSPAQAAAMAAERRMQDELWCGSGSSIETVDEAESELGESSKSSYVASQVKDRVSANEDLVSWDSQKNDVRKIAGDLLSRATTDDAEDRAIWECDICTLFNQPLAPICEACGNVKPKPVGVKFKTWTCRFCTLENGNKLDKCSACEQWRYSNGPPVATRAPNYGT